MTNNETFMLQQTGKCEESEGIDCAIGKRRYEKMVVTSVMTEVGQYLCASSYPYSRTEDVKVKGFGEDSTFPNDGYDATLNK